MLNIGYVYVKVEKNITKKHPKWSALKIYYLAVFICTSLKNFLFTLFLIIPHNLL